MVMINLNGEEEQNRWLWCAW